MIVSQDDRELAESFFGGSCSRCHVFTPIETKGEEGSEPAYVGLVPAPEATQVFGDSNLDSYGNNCEIILTAKPGLRRVADPDPTVARHFLTDSLDSLVASRLNGRLDLVVVSAAARLLLEGGRHALSKTARVVLLGTMDEFSRRSNRLLFEAGLVRVRADIGTAAAVFVRSGAVTNLDWLEFGDAHRVSFNQLGKMGRFANQAFQAAFTILYGLCNEARPVFPETYATNSLPEIARWCTGPLQFPRFQVGNDLLEKAIWAVDDPPVDIDFTGYFQNTPAVWRRHRDLLRRLISPPLAVAEAARQAAGRLQAKYGKLLVIHIRRGDAVGSPYPLFRTVPADWVGEFIQRMREEHGNIAVYIATDDPHWVLAHLSHCEVLIAASVLENPDIDRALFDFSMLKHADIMGCANSSFSKMASLLAEEGQIVFLPSFYRNRYEPYDPWSVDPFWTPFVYLSEADMLRYNSRHRMWLRCLGLT